MRFFYVFLFLMVSILPGHTTEIGFEKFTLKNGLRVIVHEDRNAPIVSVGVWYQVGSKDEPKGKTGFAHLFEHAMFRGSENFTDSFDVFMKDMGASGVNGSTSFDWTNFYATVPTPALERLLWLESDRMGFLLSAVTQKSLDDERKIVQNEKRQREGQPYGLLPGRMNSAIYPANHPYHHTPIGSMDDLNNASLEDVHNWFKQYYGAANAILVLSGDIDAATARTLAEKYFGDIAAGPPLYRAISNIPARLYNTKDVMYDRVPESLINRSWVIPGRTDQEKIMLDVASAILGGGETGRLYKRLVKEMDVATTVSVSVDGRGLSSIFGISASLKKGRNMADLEQAIDDVMAEFLAKGPTKAELSKNRDYIDTVVLRELNSISVKGMVLAEGEIFAADPGFIHKDLNWTRNATRKKVQAAARKWLSKGYHQISVLPYGTPHKIRAQIDRSLIPEVKNTLSLKFPKIQETTLPNGLKVILAERHETPTINMAMVFKNAASIGEIDGKVGASSALFYNMSQFPKGMSKEAYERQMVKLGAQIGIGGSTFDATMGISALAKHFPDTMDLAADLLLKPAFSKAELIKWQDAALLGIKNARANPNAVANRVMGRQLYGDSHPLSYDPDQEKNILTLDVADMKTQYARWIRPDNAVLYVTGNITMADLLKQVNRVFGKWKAPKAELPKVTASYAVPVYKKTKVILIDRPASPQTLIIGGRVITSKPDEEALNAANAVLGGGMSSRISDNLRVKKGWSYGAGSGVSQIPGQYMWNVSAPVQASRTADSLAEIIKEMTALSGDKPVLQTEIDNYRKGQILTLPAQLESSGAVLSSMLGNAFLGKPLNDVEQLGSRLDKLKLADVQAAAKTYLQPEGIVWVLVGNLSKFEKAVREMNLGDVEIWSMEGKKISE